MGSISVELVLFFVEEEVFLAWVIGPNILYRFIEFAFILHLLQVFDDFDRRTRALGIIDQFITASRPWRIFQLGSEF